ncbi:MAG: hypothetical protein ACPL0B_03690, partial [Anaerolineales bacterium]
VYYQSDAIFRNVDDYKNWEMEQLQAAIFSDALLGQTLKQLETMDRYWKDKTISDIRAMLHVYWRNAGVWHLVAEAPKPIYARQLVETWKKTILDNVGGALAKSNDWLRWNTELQVASRIKIELLARQSMLTQMQQIFSHWLNSTEAKGENALELQKRWRFYDLAARLGEQNAAGKDLLHHFPPPDSSASQYLIWMQQAMGIIEGEQALIEAQLPIIDEKINQDTQKISAFSNASWGLSAYIHLDPLNTEIKPPHAVRTSALMAFVGSMLTLLISGIIWLALTERRVKG